MKRAFLALALLTACADDYNACPLVGYVDGFELTLARDAWDYAEYEVDVSYSDDYGNYAFTCAQTVPFYTADSAMDGGLEARNDAGIASAGSWVFSCRRNIPTGASGQGRVGRALVLSFDGTPQAFNLTVRDRGNVVLPARDVPLAYRQFYPHGESCGGPLRAFVTVDLP